MAIVVISIFPTCPCDFRPAHDFDSANPSLKIVTFFIVQDILSKFLYLGKYAESLECVHIVFFVVTYNFSKGDDRNIIRVFIKGRDVVIKN